MSTGPKPEVVQAVLERDQWTCIRCGNPIQGTRGYHWSIHHRQPRGMGGTKELRANSPSNLVTVCGHGTYGCHGQIERRRSESEVLGLIVRHPTHPATVQLLIKNQRHPDGQWLYLDDFGAYTDHSPTALEATP